MTEDLRQINALLEQGIADDRLPEKTRLVFSEIKAILPFIGRNLAPFFKVGDSVLEAIAHGRFDDASKLSLEFRKTEDAFGPDIAELRQKLATYQLTMGSGVLGEMKTFKYMSFGLFAFAACLGIGVGLLVSSNIIRTLRRLVDGTKAFQAGEVTVTIPIGSNDEVGQLATAFNRMVAEIHAKEKYRMRLANSSIRALSPIWWVSLGTWSTPTGRSSPCSSRTSRASRRSASNSPPRRSSNLLNHYFAAVTDSIRASNGIVDKFIGDGVMAFWSPPFSPGETHAVAACLSALQQQESIKQLNQDLPNIVGLRRNAPNIAVRMGIATGEVVLGTIGSTVSKSFTVIGDTVNLASRLESVNKIYGTRIIVADTTLRLTGHEFETRELDLITVVGKTEPVRIFELLCPAGQIKPEEEEFLGEFGKGLVAYRAREWGAAGRQFQRCLEITPTDTPSALYIERIAALRKDPPPAAWDGVWRFMHK